MCGAQPVWARFMQQRGGLFRLATAAASPAAGAAGGAMGAPQLTEGAAADRQAAEEAGAAAVGDDAGTGAGPQNDNIATGKGAAAG